MSDLKAAGMSNNQANTNYRRWTASEILSSEKNYYPQTIQNKELLSKILYEIETNR